MLESKQMKHFQIGFPSPKKKAIFITGGFHAREWLAVSTALFAIHKVKLYLHYPMKRALELNI